MKRTPLRRKSRLKRAAKTKPAKRTKYARRERDWDRMAWSKTLRCALPHAVFGVCPLSGDMVRLWLGGGMDSCAGPTEAHHAGERAGWRKAPDDTVVPLCSGHHRALTDRTGCFSGWPKGALKQWELAAVAYYSARYTEHLATVGDALF